MLFRLAPHPHERVEQIVNYFLLSFGHASLYPVSKHADEGVQSRRCVLNSAHRLLKSSLDRFMALSAPTQSPCGAGYFPA
jgi:hypothetical protein